MKCGTEYCGGDLANDVYYAPGLYIVLCFRLKMLYSSYIGLQRNENDLGSKMFLQILHKISARCCQKLDCGYL